MQTFLMCTGVVVAVLILLAVGLPRSMRVERTVEIAASPSSVYATLVKLESRARWSPWHAKEPNAQYAYSGTGVGAKMEFDGKEVGAGSVVVTGLTPDRRIETTLRFSRPFQLEASDVFTIEPSPRGARVTWVNEAALASFGNRIFGVFADRVLGADYQQGLDNLRGLFEAPVTAAAIQH